MTIPAVLGAKLVEDAPDQDGWMIPYAFHEGNEDE